MNYDCTHVWRLTSVRVVVRLDRNVEVVLHVARILKQIHDFQSQIDTGHWTSHILQQLNVTSFIALNRQYCGDLLRPAVKRASSVLYKVTAPPRHLTRRTSVRGRFKNCIYMHAFGFRSNRRISQENTDDHRIAALHTN